MRPNTTSVITLGFRVCVRGEGWIVRSLDYSHFGSRVLKMTGIDEFAFGLPRAEWNEIMTLTSGTVSRTVTDTTLPTAPVERRITYQAPFTKSDRETDYAMAWGRLAAREKP